MISSLSLNGHVSTAMNNTMGSNSSGSSNYNYNSSQKMNSNNNNNNSNNNNSYHNNSSNNNTHNNSNHNNHNNNIYSVNNNEHSSDTFGGVLTRSTNTHQVSLFVVPLLSLLLPVLRGVDRRYPLSF